MSVAISSWTRSINNNGRSLRLRLLQTHSLNKVITIQSMTHLSKKILWNIFLMSWSSPRSIIMWHQIWSFLGLKIQTNWWCLNSSEASLYAIKRVLSKTCLKLRCKDSSVFFMMKLQVWNSLNSKTLSSYKGVRKWWLSCFKVKQKDMRSLVLSLQKLWWVISWRSVL